MTMLKILSKIPELHLRQLPVIEQIVTAIKNIQIVCNNLVVQITTKMFSKVRWIVISLFN